MKPMKRALARSGPPLSAGLWVALLLLSAALTGYFGLYAAGYLVPAACLALQAALVWTGRAKAVVVAITALNQLSGLVLILVLAFGEPLGIRKLDVSAAALLLNLATGGPLMGLLSLPLLGSLRFNVSLRGWFGERPTETLKEAFSI